MVVLVVVDIGILRARIVVMVVVFKAEVSLVVLVIIFLEEAMETVSVFIVSFPEILSIILMIFILSVEAYMPLLILKPWTSPRPSSRQGIVNLTRAKYDELTRAR
ncbi:hypothetical protein NL676_036825 [Syzygium grande]|nr:hypothetical protein NL676_036825 [Syzygium grande]